MENNTNDKTTLTPEEEAKIEEMTQNGELTEKTAKKGFFQKVKGFCAKHWRKAAVTAGGAALLAAGYFIGKATSGRDEDYELIDGQEGEWNTVPLEETPETPEEPTVD